MSDWRDDPAQVQERAERGVAALRKMQEGLEEYLASTRDNGDLEVIEQAFVFFESRGMGDGGSHYRGGGIVLEDQASYNAMYGLLSRQPAMLLDAMDPMNQCEHGHGD